eukprot:g1662.t1
MKVRADGVAPAPAKDSADSHHDASILERGFANVGKSITLCPWIYIICSVVVSLAFSAGFFIPGLLVSENRPEKQWVPLGADALEQKIYVDETWPSTQRFNFFIAKCRGEGCNLLDAKYVRRLRDINERIMRVTVDGEAVRTSEEYSSRGKPLYTAEQWDEWGYNGTFQFRQNFS